MADAEEKHDLCNKKIDEQQEALDDLISLKDTLLEARNLTEEGWAEIHHDAMAQMASKSMLGRHFIYTL